MKNESIAKEFLEEALQIMKSAAERTPYDDVYIDVDTFHASLGRLAPSLSQIISTRYKLIRMSTVTQLQYKSLVDIISFRIDDPGLTTYMQADLAVTMTLFRIISNVLAGSNKPDIKRLMSCTDKKTVSGRQAISESYDVVCNRLPVDGKSIVKIVKNDGAN